MPRHGKPLPVLEIADPCPVDFHAMPTADRSRFCAHCQCPVHDLSAMRSDEVAHLLCRNAGQLCVRVERLADGQIKTLDYQALAPRRWSLRWLALGILTLIGAGALATWLATPRYPVEDSWGSVMLPESDDAGTSW
jgi:hypothetical protein